MDKLNGHVLLIEDDDILGRLNTISDKLSTDLKKEFNSEHISNKTVLQTKIKSRGDACYRFLR